MGRGREWDAAVNKYSCPMSLHSGMGKVMGEREDQTINKQSKCTHQNVKNIVAKLRSGTEIWSARVMVVFCFEWRNQGSSHHQDAES